MAKVEGIVKYKGKPLTTGEVVFLPDDSKGTVGPPARGTIGREGTYILSTEFAGDGALVGFHRVGLTGMEPAPSTPEKPIARPTRSSRKAGTSSRQNAPMQPPASRGSNRYLIVTPMRLKSPGTSNVVVEVRQGSNRLRFDIQESGEVDVGP